MYDVGQGNNIMEGNGKVFSIKLKDNSDYVCPHEDPDYTQKPIQIPLGEFEKYDYKSLNELYNRENYEHDTQHSNAGELSDISLLIIISVVCLVLMYFIFFKG